jgi:hypothetical protein
VPKQLLVDGSYATRQNILAAAQGPSELIGSLGEDRSQAKLRRQGVSPEFFSDRFAAFAQSKRRSRSRSGARRIVIWTSLVGDRRYMRSAGFPRYKRRLSIWTAARSPC